MNRKILRPFTMFYKQQLLMKPNGCTVQYEIVGLFLTNQGTYIHSFELRKNHVNYNIRFSHHFRGTAFWWVKFHP